MKSLGHNITEVSTTCSGHSFECNSQQIGKPGWTCADICP